MKNRTKVIGVMIFAGAINTASGGPPRLTEAEACKMAIAESQRVQSIQNRGCSAPRVIQSPKCTGFLTNMAQGRAQIRLDYVESMGCGYGSIGVTSPENFQAFDQGWQIIKREWR